MTTLLMMPPLDSDIRSWADRLRADLPELEVVLAEGDDEVRAALPNADASYGWVSPENLPLATRLRWLQNPFAGPFPGYYHDALIEHPVVITNPRGIYSDHIAHHILMFMLALSRGLPYWMEAQRRGRWERHASVATPTSPNPRCSSTAWVASVRKPPACARLSAPR